MSVLEILKYPDPILRKQAKPVGIVDAKIKKFAQDMIETMYAAPGIGLAAPQVGESIRLIVVDITQKKEGPIVLINPKVISSEGECFEEEGCLSVPDLKEPILRKQKIFIKGLDIEGNTIQISADDLLAIVLQHEIDHLDGILIIDRISNLKRDIYKKKLQKKSKKEV
ncbi:MAG: peptide deformylase [Thermodesulfobacteriota bacterium]|nr:peptide deformylase [Thermodesulfobacteriota bacterium]